MLRCEEKKSNKGRTEQFLFFSHCCCHCSASGRIGFSDGPDHRIRFIQNANSSSCHPGCRVLHFTVQSKRLFTSACTERFRNCGAHCRWSSTERSGSAARTRNAEATSMAKRTPRVEELGWQRKYCLVASVVLHTFIQLAARARMHHRT
jgi:hypothetical protein